MYAYFKGTLVDKKPEEIIVETAGIGYRIVVSAGTGASLPPVGEEVKIYTYTCVREGEFSLYGFLTSDDLEIFKKLINVKGIGPKGGQNILSVLSPDELRYAIITGDAKAISKAPGIGNKTAQQILLDLHDKVSAEDLLHIDVAGDSVSTSAGTLSDSAAEAVEALTALGYSRAEASKAVREVKNASELDVNQLLKEALKHML